MLGLTGVGSVGTEEARSPRLRCSLCGDRAYLRSVERYHAPDIVLWVQEGSESLLIHFRRRPLGRADELRAFETGAGRAIAARFRHWRAGETRSMEGLEIRGAILSSGQNCSDSDGVICQLAVVAERREAMPSMLARLTRGLRPPQARLPRSSIPAKPPVVRNSISDYFGFPWPEKLR
jgi:hypothetical protein